MAAQRRYGVLKANTGDKTGEYPNLVGPWPPANTFALPVLETMQAIETGVENNRDNPNDGDNSAYLGVLYTKAEFPTAVHEGIASQVPS